MAVLLSVVPRHPQVVEFLQSLTRQLRRLLILWDGLPAHRSRVVKHCLEAQRGAIQVERLPAYAPELNPVEYVWGHLKNHERANLCAESFDGVRPPTLAVHAAQTDPGARVLAASGTAFVKTFSI